MIDIRDPSIEWANLPASEQQASMIISGSLRNLKSYVEKFGDALSLFNFCEHQARLADGNGARNAARILRDWKLFAVRDGAMSIWHFKKTMNGIRDNSSQCTSIGINKSKLKISGTAYRNYFGEYDDVRNAIARAGELVSTVKQYARNTMSGDYHGEGIEMIDCPGAFISEYLNDRKFITNGFDGAIVPYEISEIRCKYL